MFDSDILPYGNPIDICVNWTIDLQSPYSDRQLEHGSVVGCWPQKINKNSRAT